MRVILWILGLCYAAFLAGCSPLPGGTAKAATEKTANPQNASQFAEVPLRLAYFPNVTHAPAILGVADGTFQKAVGNTANITTLTFTNGPSAMEALLAREVDIAYVGASPAINAYIKSDGALKIVSGAASGGAVLVVRADAGIQTVPDLIGKRIGTPQKGGTQDIAARYLITQTLGQKLFEDGGTTQIIPTETPQLATLFEQKALEAAWVQEPWGARLIKEQNARLLLDERDTWPARRYATTVIVARTEFLDAHRDIVTKIVAAHKDLSERIESDKLAVAPTLNSEIKRITKRGIAPDVLADSLSRVDFTADPYPDTLKTQAEHAFALGFLGRTQPDLSGLLDVSAGGKADINKKKEGLSHLFPSPLVIGQFIIEAIREGTLFPAIATSLLRGGVGYVISLFCGTLLGLALAQSRFLDKTVGVVVVGLQSLPSVCWFPPALLWFGLNENAVLFVVIMGALFSVTLAVRSGIRNLSPLTRRAAQTLGATGLKLWWYVLLPAILPAYLGGMRQGWAFAWRSLMAAELLSQSLRTGVGHLLATGRDLNDMPMVLGMIVVILCVGLLVDRCVFLPLERFIARRWGVEGA